MADDERPDNDENQSSGESAEQQESGKQRDSDSGQDGSKSRRRKVLTAKGAVRRSLQHLEEMTGRVPESVIAIEQDEDYGWKVSLELVESSRIPDSTDILAEYTVRIDSRGELVSYRRESRYSRGRTQDRS